MTNEMPKYEELTKDTNKITYEELMSIVNSIQHILDDKHLDELSVKLPF